MDVCFFFFLTWMNFFVFSVLSLTSSNFFSNAHNFCFFFLRLLDGNLAHIYLLLSLSSVSFIFLLWMCQIVFFISLWCLVYIIWWNALWWHHILFVDCENRPQISSSSKSPYFCCVLPNKEKAKGLADDLMMFMPLGYFWLTESLL